MREGNRHVLKMRDGEEKEGLDPQGGSLWLDWSWLSLCELSLSAQDR